MYPNTRGRWKKYFHSYHWFLQTLKRRSFKSNKYIIPLLYPKVDAIRMNILNLITWNFLLVPEHIDRYISLHQCPMMKIVRKSVYHNFILVYFQQVRLINHTDTYRNWKDMPTPIFLSVTFFNITNPNDLITGAKPRVVEMGPYVYRYISVAYGDKADAADAMDLIEIKLRF